MKVSVITNRGVGIVRSAANRHEKCEIVDAKNPSETKI